ncbi:hypothetical protein V8G61_06830 [Gaetbulibacter sp. M240]|uniref:hypothetical protein n=1 Tax=Gaetbulibacter sp. M240 TaxID=3126511 RepID=UPI00374ECAAA
MKTLISTVIASVITLLCGAQNLECCHSISEVKKVLEGDWLLKKDSRNRVYRIHFQDSAGKIEVLEELNLPPKAEHTAVEDAYDISESIVNISAKKDGYYIELVYTFGSVTERIRVLTENSLVYGTGKSEHIFIRDKR